MKIINQTKARQSKYKLILILKKVNVITFFPIDLIIITSIINLCNYMNVNLILVDYEMQDLVEKFYRVDQMIFCIKN